MGSNVPNIPVTKAHDRYKVACVTFGVWADVVIQVDEDEGSDGTEVVYDCGLIVGDGGIHGVGLAVTGFSSSKQGSKFQFSRVLVGDTLIKVGGQAVGTDLQGRLSHCIGNDTAALIMFLFQRGGFG
jgi:hypothetical protein